MSQVIVIDGLVGYKEIVVLSVPEHLTIDMLSEEYLEEIKTMAVPAIRLSP